MNHLTTGPVSNVIQKRRREKKNRRIKSSTLYSQLSTKHLIWFCRLEHFSTTALPEIPQQLFSAREGNCLREVGTLLLDYALEEGFGRAWERWGSCAQKLMKWVASLTGGPHTRRPCPDSSSENSNRVLLVKRALLKQRRDFYELFFSCSHSENGY